jgi:hypothetical protein
LGQAYCIDLLKRVPEKFSLHLYKFPINFYEFWNFGAISENYLNGVGILKNNKWHHGLISTHSRNLPGLSIQATYRAGRGTLAQPDS